MESKKLLIIGYGNIGREIAKEFAMLDPVIAEVDPHKLQEAQAAGLSLYNPSEHYTFAVLAVDTPLNWYGSDFDYRDLDRAMASYKDHVDTFVVRSTVGFDWLESTAQSYQIIFSPEFYGTTPHSKLGNVQFDTTIVASDNRVLVEQYIQLLQHCYPASQHFTVTGFREAVIAKLMENSFIATKVSFCNAFAKICKENGVEYTDVRELFLTDPRFNPSHTFVYSDQPYWSSHCLNKDVPYTARALNSKFMAEIFDYNATTDR